MCIHCLSNHNLCLLCREREAVAVKPVQESQLLKGPDSVKHAMVSAFSCKSPNCSLPKLKCVP